MKEHSISQTRFTNIMDLSNFTTLQNLESAFGGESMANRKYLFFAEVARKLGFTDLAKLFKETADQETDNMLLLTLNCYIQNL